MISSAEIVAAIAVFLSLAIGIILFVILYQRRVINHQLQLRAFNHQMQIEIMQASIRAEDEERSRIAADLHDDVGATLSSIRLFLHQVASKPGDRELLEQTRILLDMSIQKVRDISHQLQPATLTYIGLLKSLRSLAELVSRSERMQVAVRCQDDWAEPRPDVSLALYRIVQELINNIVKHADASSVTISAELAGPDQQLRISHNGTGLTEAGYRRERYKDGAIGLKNIESRVKSANLAIRFETAPDGIYSVVLCMTKSHINNPPDYEK